MFFKIWNLTAESLRSGAWRGQVTTLRTSSTNPGRLIFSVAEKMSFPSLGVGANFVRRCKMQHRWVTLSWGDEGFLWKSWGEKYGELWSSEFLGTWTLWRKFEVCCGVLVSFNIDIRFLESCILQVFLNLHFKMQMFCWCFHFTVSKNKPRRNGRRSNVSSVPAACPAASPSQNHNKASGHQWASGWENSMFRHGSPRTNGMVRDSSNRK